jgi:hypothetical protein
MGWMSQNYHVGTGMAIPPARCQVSAPEAQMKLMKHNQMVLLRSRGFGGVVVTRRATARPFALGSVAVCALVIHGLTAARAADPLPARETAGQATQALKQAYSPQAYQMKRYQAFARQAEMPVIAATDKTTLEVGGTVKMDIKRLAQPSSKEQEALASQLGVPAGVIGKTLECASNNPAASTAQLAQDIRTAVIDYRFLQGEWGKYNPPPEGQKLKADALQALQAGDISKAWQLYDGLQKPQAPGIAPPQPPANLRIISQQ